MSNPDITYNTNCEELCLNCNGSLMRNEGLFECEYCGKIVYTLDRSPEWSFYASDENRNDDPSRCGMPINPLLLESSFGCIMTLNNARSPELRRVKRVIDWHCMPYREKAQYNEFKQLESMTYHANLPKIFADHAKIYHKKISERKSYRGMNRESIMTASLYIACRINENPRTSKELSRMFMVNPKYATKGCKNALNVINNIETDDNMLYSEITPMVFVDRYCSQLNMNIEHTLLCRFVAMKIMKNNLIPENTPNAISAGIIYLVVHTCQLDIHKSTIQSVSDISEVTINKCFKKLKEHNEDLIPTKFMA